MKHMIKVQGNLKLITETNYFKKYVNFLICLER